MALIDNSNLDEKTLTNAEVLAMLNKLSMEVYKESHSRVLDAVEDLTGNRYFENSKVDEAKNSLANKVVSAYVV